MNNEQAAELLPAIQKAAKAVARKWPQVADADDIQQDILLRLLETPGSVQKLLAVEPADRAKAVERIGHQIASGERDDMAAFHGNVFYSTEDVRKVLSKADASYAAPEVVWEGDKAVPVAPDTDRPDSMTKTEQLDLELALEQLLEDNEPYAELLTQFMEGSYEVGPNRDGKPLTRAVDRLTVLMNRVNRNNRFSHEDGPGSRKAMSNASANKALKQTYEDWK